MFSESGTHLRKQMLKERSPKNHKFEIQKRQIMKRCVFAVSIIKSRTHSSNPNLKLETNFAIK